MKKTTVERMYTAKVAELLNQGWHIHTSTMPGHQGEVAHVDLTDGSEIRRALLCREMTWGRSGADFYGHKIIILVGKNTDRSGRAGTARSGTTTSRSAPKSSWPRYRSPTAITPRAGTPTWPPPRTYSASATSAGKRGASPPRRVLGTAFKSIALRWVRKQPRMKTTKLEDITKVARYTSRDGSTGFKIEAKGKTFTLHS